MTSFSYKISLHIFLNEYREYIQYQSNVTGKSESMLCFTFSKDEAYRTYFFLKQFAEKICCVHPIYNYNLSISKSTNFLEDKSAEGVLYFNSPDVSLCTEEYKKCISNYKRKYGKNIKNFYGALLYLTPIDDKEMERWVRSLLKEGRKLIKRAERDGQSNIGCTTQSLEGTFSNWKNEYFIFSNLKSALYATQSN